MSLLLPPKSGRVPIASFCVEHGRWSARGGRGCAQLLDLDGGGAVARNEAGDAGADAGGRRQWRRGHWLAPAKGLGRRQADAGAARRRTGVDVRAPQSASSLQLALENEKLADARKAYVAALRRPAAQGDDIVGYVFAVNGKLNSAEIYESNGLFRKMWPKLLDASATEAIGHRNDPKDGPRRSRR